MRTYSTLHVERIILIGFLSFITTGALLIWTFNFYASMPISFIDALFTSTSAVCVTGLIVVDTGSELARASQWTVLILIQLGGLGVMTAATTLLLLFRQKIGIRQRILFTGGLGIDTPAGAVRLLLKILQLTIFIELIGAIPLFFGFYPESHFSRALYLSVFHSVSAFCNAGFSLFSSNLEAYSNTYLVPGVIMLLIFLGGIGFLPLTNLFHAFQGKENLNFHTRFVLLISLFLILLGVLVITVFEWNGVLSGFEGGLKFWNSIFQSITPRTAGFNTVRISEFTSLGIFILCFLMIVGASPGSTGGGVKTSTFGILVLSAFSYLSGKRATLFWNRSFTNETILRALTILILYLGTIFISVIFLSITEDFAFAELIFEIISALGTVGLSMGITAGLSSAGKVMLIMLMFWGRIGILTMIYSMMAGNNIDRVIFPEITIPTG
ncbi:MAG: potassium transporter Trk [Synergistales bacterium]|nr:potassium transporter Trk [Synergistales bacterium]